MATAKKSATKKSATKKSATKKAPAKKTAAKKSTAKKSTRKYDPSVGKRVEREMHEMHQGKLKSGRSGKKVTNPKQAIAIAISENAKKARKSRPRRISQASRNTCPGSIFGPGFFLE